MTQPAELDLRRERAAHNQSLFREVNERIGELVSNAAYLEFVCECTDATCTETVPLTHEEYEHIRSDSNSFFVIPGHEIAEIEEIVESTDRYIVVAKLGRGAVVAERLDPRKRR
jgi:hypothetical protein